MKQKDFFKKPKPILFCTGWEIWGILLVWWKKAELGGSMEDQKHAGWDL